MRTMLRTALLGVMIVLAAAGQAAAHPHVLIDSHAVLEMKDGKIVSLFMGWKFDPIYGGSLAMDFDENKDGKLDPQEMAALEQESFQATGEYGYFTYPSVAGQVIADIKAQDFKVLLVDNTMVYSFRLPLPRPVDPRLENFSVSTYEETYYVDIIFPNEKAVVLTGDGAEGCRAVLGDDLANPLMGGIVHPKKADIVCE